MQELTTLRDYMELGVIADDLTGMARDLGIITAHQRYYVATVSNGQTRFVVMDNDPDLRDTQPLDESDEQITGIGGVSPYYQPASETIQRGLVVLRTLLAARIGVSQKSRSTPIT